jgi:transposase
MSKKATLKQCLPLISLPASVTSCVIQPAKGKQYARRLDEKNMTDKIDAAMLARMGL